MHVDPGASTVEFNVDPPSPVTYLVAVIGEKVTFYTKQLSPALLHLHSSLS